jgi:hydroxymethylpyrimidine pyrophosphatase-like HAD family hydrolase
MMTMDRARTSGWFRAIAVDYDGTLTTHGPPRHDVLELLARWRHGGGRVLLVTGRILDELLEVFPDAGNHVDLIVAENGAVLWDGTRSRLLASPVSASLSDELKTRGVPYRRGSAILATHSTFVLSIEAAIGALGLDVQLVSNRAELMVLPAGISKGTGVRAGLRALGLSTHSAVAVGDGENDQALLRACELGVAVANAVPSLRREADITTTAPDAEGVIELLEGPFVTGSTRAHSSRWQVELGLDDHGESVSLPASQIDVLVCGRSGGGKSYIAGLIAEQLIELDYSLLVVDPEGDHTALTELPGVVVVGSRDPIPSVEHIVSLVQQHLGTVVVDLSLQPAETRYDFYRRAPAAVELLRAARGVPHWMLLDEAHTSLLSEGAVHSLFKTNRKGHLLVTYEPAALPESVLDQIDVTIIVPGSDRIDAILRSFGCDAARFDAVAQRASGRDVIVMRRTGDGTPPELMRVQTFVRRTGHVRHRHKYTAGLLPESRRFYFRNANDDAVGEPAANIAEFHRELCRCSRDVIEHHALGRDFSRWIGLALGDEKTAAAVEAIEARITELHGGHDRVGLESERGAILAALERHYVGEDLRPCPTDDSAT